MKKFTFNRSKLLKAIRFCCLLLAFSAARAHAAPPPASNSGIFSNNGTATTSVKNTSTISGYYYGVYINGTGPTTITNSGDITALGYGIYSKNGTTNLALKNTGHITGTLGGVYLEANGTAGNASVATTNSGSIDTTSGSGYQEGFLSIALASNGFNSSNSINNSGSIVGPNFGLLFESVSGAYGSGEGGTASGNINNSGTITGTSRFGVLAIDIAQGTGNANLSITNSSHGKITGSESGIYAIVGAKHGGIANISVNNAGTVVGTSAGGSFGILAASTTALGSSTVVNSGTVSANNGGILSAATGGIVSITNSGTVSAYHGTGLKVESSGSSPSQITEIGGAVFGGGGTAILGNGNTSVKVVGAATLGGVIDGGGGTSTLTLDLAGVNPSQKAALEALLTGGSGTVTVAGQTYTWQNFASTQGSIVSLEQGVDSGLQSLAVKLDNVTAPLPVAFNSIYAAAAINPEAALDAASGREVINAVNNIGLNNTTAFGDIADNRAYDLRSGAYGISTAGLEVVDPSMQASAVSDTATHLGSLMAMADASSKTVTDANGVAHKEAPDRRFGAWVSGTVTKADQESSGNGNGYQYTTGSPSLGLDYRLTDSLVVGGLFNYSRTDVAYADSSKLAVDTELAGVYGTWFRDQWHANGLVGYGFSQYDSDRATPAATIAHGTPNGQELTAALSGGYDFKLSGWTLSPEAGIQYTRLMVGSYGESGAGALNLNVGSRDVDSFRSKLGGRLTRSFDAGWVKLSPQLSASWNHEFLADSRGVNTSFAGVPALGSFSVRSSTPERDFALVGTGLDMVFAEANAVTLFLNYDAQVQENFLANTLNAGIRVDF